MSIIDRIRASLIRGYNCNCPEHSAKPSIISLVGAYIGVAVMLSGVETKPEKRYCVMCQPEQ